MVWEDPIGNEPFQIQKGLVVPYFLKFYGINYAWDQDLSIASQQKIVGKDLFSPVMRLRKFLSAPDNIFLTTRLFHTIYHWIL